MNDWYVENVLDAVHAPLEFHLMRCWKDKRLRIALQNTPPSIFKRMPLSASLWLIVSHPNSRYFIVPRPLYMCYHRKGFKLRVDVLVSSMTGKLILHVPTETLSRCFLSQFSRGGLLFFHHFFVFGTFLVSHFPLAILFAGNFKKTLPAPSPSTTFNAPSYFPDTEWFSMKVPPIRLENPSQSQVKWIECCVWDFNHYETGHYCSCKIFSRWEKLMCIFITENRPFWGA